MLTEVLEGSQWLKGLPVKDARPNAGRGGRDAGGRRGGGRLGREHNGELVLADGQEVEEAISLHAAQNLL